MIIMDFTYDVFETSFGNSKPMIFQVQNAHFLYCLFIYTGYLFIFVLSS